MISERVENTCVYANDRSDVRPHSTETYRRPAKTPIQMSNLLEHDVLHLP